MTEYQRKLFKITSSSRDQTFTMPTETIELNETTKEFISDATMEDDYYCSRATTTTTTRLRQQQQHLGSPRCHHHYHHHHSPVGSKSSQYLTLVFLVAVLFIMGGSEAFARHNIMILKPPMKQKSSSASSLNFYSKSGDPEKHERPSIAESLLAEEVEVANAKRSSSSSSSKDKKQQNKRIIDILRKIQNGKEQKKNSGVSFQQQQPANGVSNNKRKIIAIAKRSSKRAMPKISQSIDEVEKIVEYVAETKLPTDIGQFQLRAYRVPGAPIGQEPCVIYYRDKPPFGNSKDGGSTSVPVRIHDQCLTSEVFRSQRCDCKEQLNMALKYIKEHGGCIVYLQQEGRGIGLANKIAAYSLQDEGYDTVDANLHLGLPADAREYTVVPAILEDMKIDSIRLMTNNPRKTNKLTALGVEITNTIPVVVPEVNEFNYKYMETKQNRMHHANLQSLFHKTAAEKIAIANGKQLSRNLMAPLMPIAEQYVNNGTEMSANAIQFSLMDEETINDEGVQARDDGYCFGKQSVLDAISAIERGEKVVVVDDMDRENEGDFIMAAEKCTDMDIAEIIRYSSGVICVGMEGKRLDELKLPAMVANNEDPKGTAFTVTVDAIKKHGITTGISASDRAKTLQLLADPTVTAEDFNRPGHIFPLRAREGGVLQRDGHTEAAVDLSRLAGLSPVGVLCEIVSEENPTEMMRLPEIKRFCAAHGFVLTSIVDIAQYRKETEGKL